MATNRDKQCRGKNLLANIANNRQQQKQAWPGQEQQQQQQQQQQSNGPGRQQHFVNHSIYQIQGWGGMGPGYIGTGGIPVSQVQLVGSIAMASVHIIERFLLLLSLSVFFCSYFF